MIVDICYMREYLVDACSDETRTFGDTSQNIIWCPMMRKEHRTFKLSPAKNIY